jgi:hypothetical protein
MSGELCPLAWHENTRPAVRTRLNFSQRIPRAYANSADPSRDIRPIESHEVAIHDARPIRDSLSLDVQGFELVEHVSSVIRQYEGEALEKAYHEEVGALVMAKTGAEIILPYRPLFQVRLSIKGETAGVCGSGRTRHAQIVHQDVSGKTFRVWMEDTMAAEGETIPRWSRCVLYNTWRAISEPPHDFPLAVNDASRTRSRECVIMDNEVGRDYFFETLVGVYDPADRWYCFSDMREHELLIFKAYDTRFGDTQTVLHTSFDNCAEPGTSPRESIETRFFAFWF